jgi:predicted CXXCH cytochrome family protein
MVFTNDISFLCLTCHGDVKEASHPVEMTPSMNVPGEFPLDWKGEMTCVTCHTIHRRGYDPSHLRSAVLGEAFCKRCHTSLYDGADMHKTVVETAHVGGRYSVGDVTRVIDALSMKCLVCHDATLASGGDVESVGMGKFRHRTNIGLSHPIGVSHVEARRKYQGAYRRVEDLPPEIKLFNGTVGCGSCHNPFSVGHSELVMSNEESALCFACHVK